MPDRDIQSVRIVGTFAFGIGMIITLLTLLATLFLLFSGDAANTSHFAQGALTIGLALVMSFTLISGGSQLQRIRPYHGSDLESLRLSWTALVVIMFMGGVAAFWLAPPLSALGALMLIALIAIRGPVIRLTRS